MTDRKIQTNTQPYPPPLRQDPNRGPAPRQIPPKNQTFQGLGPANSPVQSNLATAPRQARQPVQEQKQNDGEEAEKRPRRRMVLGQLAAVSVGLFIGFTSMHFLMPYLVPEKKWGTKPNVAASAKPSDAPSGSTMPRGPASLAVTAPPTTIAASASNSLPVPASVTSAASAGQPATPKR